MGSVKSNVGHCEGASGIISVIKAAMMLEKGFILPNINFENANPTIPLKEWNMKVSFTFDALSKYSASLLHQITLTRQRLSDDYRR